MNSTSQTPFPETNIQQFNLMRPTSAQPVITTSTAGPTSDCNSLTLSLMEQCHEFTLFRAEACRLRQAAIIFGNDSDPELQANLKENCDKIESLRKVILKDLKVKKTMNKPALEDWNKLTEAVLRTYREVISKGMKQIEINYADCLVAFNSIDGIALGDTVIINSQKQTQDTWFKCIEESISKNRSKNLKTMIEKLLLSERTARCHFQDLTALKIEYIKISLDAINPIAPLCNQVKTPLFAGILTKQNPTDIIKTYPLMTALQEQRNLKGFSTQQMKHVLAEANCRKEFFQQAQLLQNGFSSGNNTMTQLAKQFLTAKKKLAECRTTLEEKIFTPATAPATIAPPTPELLTDLLQKTEQLSLSPQSASNVLMSPRSESSLSQTSPDSMTVSPPPPVTDDEKSPLFPFFRPVNVIPNPAAKRPGK